MLPKLSVDRVMIKNKLLPMVWPNHCQHDAFPSLIILLGLL